MVAVAMHLTPDDVWAMNPTDLATCAEILAERGK